VQNAGRELSQELSPLKAGSAIPLILITAWNEASRERIPAGGSEKPLGEMETELLC
jgi:hypothetical protein